MSMNSAGKNDGYGGKKMTSGGSGAAATGQEFIIQLATTRKMLFNILEKHDAVPDRVKFILFAICIRCTLKSSLTTLCTLLFLDYYYAECFMGPKRAESGIDRE